jgi:hypothetical protein
MTAKPSTKNLKNPLQRREKANGQGWVQFRKDFPPWNPLPPHAETLRGAAHDGVLSQKENENECRLSLVTDFLRRLTYVISQL